MEIIRLKRAMNSVDRVMATLSVLNPQMLKLARANDLIEEVWEDL